MAFQKGNKLSKLRKSFKRSEETKQKISQANKGKHLSSKTEFKKGHMSWTKEKHLSEETKRKIGLKSKGRKHSEESKRKMSETRKQRIKEGKIISPMLNKHHSKEAKEKIGKGTKGKTYEEIYGKHHSEEIRKKIGLSVSETKRKLFKEGKLKISKEAIEKTLKTKYGKNYRKASKEELEEFYINRSLSFYKIAKIFNVCDITIGNWLRKYGIPRRTLSESQKLLWQNPNSFYHNKEYQEKRIKATLKALIKRPTKLEQKYINLFQKYNISFDYCGNGSLLIGFKNPDFVESNGRKLCIETANKIEKSIKRKNRRFMYNSWQEYEQNRVNHFAKFGWKCLVLWEDELENEKNLLNKIQKFIQ